MAGARTTDIGAHGRAGEEQPGKVEKGVGPVGPAGDEAVKLTECLLGPGVQSSLGGIARGKLNHDKRSWDKEEERSQNPKAERRCSIVGGGGDPARAEDGSDVEEQHIPEAHLPAQLRLGFDTLGSLQAGLRDLLAPKKQSRGTNCSAGESDSYRAKRLPDLLLP